MTILGIESSCDETAAAVVKDGRTVLSSVVESQIDLHAVYGGVVPEIASRSHVEAIVPVIDQALSKAFESEVVGKFSALKSSVTWDKIDAIAVTHGPGLSGSLLIGTLAARTLALVRQKPIIGVNHVLAHAYVNWLSQPQPEFPVLALIVSGGHTQLVLFEDHFRYELLGQTKDDAVGEAFDKVAKMLGLPYPGGPSVARLALEGDSSAFQFPKARLDNPYDFSFSGLKTAVLRALQAEIGEGHDFPSHQLAERLSDAQKSNVAASFQYVAVATIVTAVTKAVEAYQPKSIILGGGVAANQELRKQLSESMKQPLSYPTLDLCTDNAVMIATCAYYQLQSRQNEQTAHTLAVIPSLSM